MRAGKKQPPRPVSAERPEKVSDWLGTHWGSETVPIIKVLRRDRESDCRSVRLCGRLRSVRKAITKRAQVERKLTKKTDLDGKRCSSKRKFLRYLSLEKMFVSVLRLLGRQRSGTPGS